MLLRTLFKGPLAKQMIVHNDWLLLAYVTSNHGDGCIVTKAQTQYLK